MFRVQIRRGGAIVIGKGKEDEAEAINVGSGVLGWRKRRGGVLGLVVLWV